MDVPALAAVGDAGGQGVDRAPLAAVDGAGGRVLGAAEFVAVRRARDRAWLANQGRRTLLMQFFSC